MDRHLPDIANQTLFPKAASWIFGANIPGKKRTVMFYLGGMKDYRGDRSSARDRPRDYPGFLTERRRPRGGLRTRLSKYATVNPTTGETSSEDFDDDLRRRRRPVR